MQTDPTAGQLADPSLWVDIPRLMTAYHTRPPDASVPEQRVTFGTSGHCGPAFDCSCNEDHILAITQDLCAYRRWQGIDGPVFLGMDTHALSESAFAAALEVLAVHEMEVRIDDREGYTPTPVTSHAISTHNDPARRQRGQADGIAVTPSHDPPEDGGFEYDPPAGGPADSEVTGWIQAEAQALVEATFADLDGHAILSSKRRSR